MEQSPHNELQDLIAKRLFKVTTNKKGVNLLNEEEEKLEQIINQSRLTIPEQPSSTEPDFVRVEKNIAAFGFFTPSSKRIENKPKTIKFTQTVEGNKVEAQVKISGNVEYGMPVTADQDKYLAFQKIIDRIKQETGKVENPITFATAELLALLGTSKNGNRYKDVEEWLKVMNTTFIESEGAVWIAGKKRYASDSFVIFQRVRRTGQELDDGSIADKNYVWLSDWYLENLNNYYLLPIDFDNYKLLRNNISKALIPLLQIWLYASREVGRFEKRYSEICQTLNITEYKKPSDIKRFFGNSLDELVEHQYLAAWEIEKTADKKDFKIVFHHGLKFYADRKRVKRLFQNKAENALKASQTEVSMNSSPSTPSKGKSLTERQTDGNNNRLKNDSSTFSLNQLPPTLTYEQKQAVKEMFKEYQISLEKGIELVSQHFEQVKIQLEMFPYRNIQPKNKAGYLIDAIEKGYIIPDHYQAEKKKRAEAEKLRKRRETEAKAEREREAESERWLQRKERGEQLYAELSNKERTKLTSWYKEKLLKEPIWANADFSVSFQKKLFDKAVQGAIEQALILREEAK
jgi:hypothetical protein